MIAQKNSKGMTDDQKAVGMAVLKFVLVKAAIYAFIYFSARAVRKSLEEAKD